MSERILILQRDIYRRVLDLIIEDERRMWTTDVIQNLAHDAIKLAETAKQEIENESNGTQE